MTMDVGFLGSEEERIEWTVVMAVVVQGLGNGASQVVGTSVSVKHADPRTHGPGKCGSNGARGRRTGWRPC